MMKTNNTSGVSGGMAALCAATRPAAGVKSQPKRGNWFARTVCEGGIFTLDSLVPVSFVAKEWNVTPRRIRSLLVAGRLEGRRQENGYWEVVYPYRFIIGTRGPALKRSLPPKRGRPKAELKAV